MSEEENAHDEEIQTLQSIYLPEELTVTKLATGTYKLKILINVSIPENYKVRYVLNEKDGPCYLNINYLKQIELKIWLCKGYPSTKGPSFQTSCYWLSKKQQRKLRLSLHKVWEENFGFPIIFTWIEFIKNDFLTIFGIEEELDLMQILVDNDEDIKKKASTSKKKIPSNPLGFIMRLIHNIEVHNMHKVHANFLNSYNYCGICCVDKLGKDSIRFEPCRHVFCNECLTNYFTTLINEGSSCAVKCPEYKCTSEAAQYQVRQLLPPELFEKYDSALLSTMLDSMNDIVYCPRPMCQYPVTLDNEERIAVCPQCKYAFCVHCRMGYHGIEPCKYSPEEREKLIDLYQNGTKEEKEAMETRYGKKHLTSLIDNFLSEGWKDVNGKRCPKCNIVIEKNHGCNKMTCFRCQTPFCWLCSKILDPLHPYYHYQDLRSSCTGQLFLIDDNLELDDEDERDWFEIMDDSGSEDIQGEDSDTDDDNHIAF